MKIDYQEKIEGYYEQERPEILASVPAEAKRVLDIGCGNGAFLTSLKNRQEVEAWGIEPNAISASQAMIKIDHCFSGTIEQHIGSLPKQYFDVIFFNDVLEHLQDPFAVLQLVHDHLNDKGIVIASIPNVLYFSSLYFVLKTKDWKYEKEGVMDYTHLRFFSRKSMIRMFEEAGYQVQSVQGIHPTQNAKFKIVNTLLMGTLDDFKFQQFVIHAK